MPEKNNKVWINSALLQPLRFILVGTVNTLVGLSVIFAAKGIGGFDDFLSNLIGYSFGLVISYFLNRKWTFRHDGHMLPTAVRFIIAFLLSYIANLITVYGFRDWVGVNSYIAQATGIIPYTVIFYFTCRYYVFPENSSLNMEQH